MKSSITFFFLPGTYSTYLTTVPAIVWALFVGAWIDRYVRARKILMLLTVFAGVVENIISIYLSIKFETSELGHYSALIILNYHEKIGVYFNLLLHMPTALLGGSMGGRIAITHYMSATTPPKLMAIRFMIFEICLYVGMYFLVI